MMTKEVEEQLEAEADTDAEGQTDTYSPSPDSSTKSNKELKKESNRTNLDKPAWYGPVRELYEQGEMSKGEFENQFGEEATDMLDGMGFISNNHSIRLSPDGHEAFTRFREQQLNYAKLNVPRIITILAALTAAVGSIGLSDLPGEVKISSLIFLTIIFLVAAVIIEFVLKQI